MYPDGSYGEPSLGEIVKRERVQRGMSFGALAEASGLSKSQLHGLENDRPKYPNPAHLAAVSGPLGLSLSRLYTAAGFDAADLPRLEPELAKKLAALSPKALNSITVMVDALTDSGSAPEDDDTPRQEGREGQNYDDRS